LFVHSEDDKLFLFSFRILVKAYKNDYSIKNHLGWAAALDYVWKNQSNEPVSQAAVAKMYGVSVSSVGKYVKLIKNMT
jgi:hypothetical protein